MEPSVTFRPKFVTFDTHGTMIHFDMQGAARDHYADKLSADAMIAFNRAFSAFRMDEVYGAWKPYSALVHNALERACREIGIAFDPAVAEEIYARVPTWGPHADVPAGLAAVAKEFPLVALTNSDNAQIVHNVAKLGAPVHLIVTSEDAQAYKPQMKPFEVMLDKLGCGPEDILHLSSSFRYDLMTAHDMRITNKVWVNRGHEPANPYYGYTEIADISGLPAVLGL
ncbi:MAG: haloacid dehalogenase type II [Pseudomonadota bacterium]